MIFSILINLMAYNLFAYKTNKKHTHTQTYSMFFVVFRQEKNEILIKNT